MKKILLISTMILCGSMIIWSQVPQAMTYKAIAKDDWGVALPSKAITLRFTIIEGSETGSEVYREVHYTITNKFGLMDVEIGKGIPDLGMFSSIEWSTGTYYLKIEMDPKGGSDFRIEDPPHQLLSIPYALYAGKAGYVVNESQKLTLSTNMLSISETGDNTVTFNNWDIDNTDDVNISGDQVIAGIKTFTDKIIVPEPINANDASTKAYVDALEARILALEADIEGLTDKDSDGYKVGQGDCDDDDPSINSGAIEIYNSKDDNCNGQIDEGFVCVDLSDTGDELTQAYYLGMIYDDPDFNPNGYSCSGVAKNPYDEDWLKVYAIDTPEGEADSFVFKVNFLNNPGNKWIFDLYINNGTTLYASSTSPIIIYPKTTSDLTSNDTQMFYIRVRLRIQSPSIPINCDEFYTIRISNGEL